MTRTSRRARFLSGAVAAAITAILFQGVAGLSRPTGIEQTARARVEAMTLALVAPAAPAAPRTAPR